MKKFLFIVDSFSVETRVEMSLSALGLKEGENYLICEADQSTNKIMEGNPGERIVDAQNLLVLISSFRGLTAPSIALAQKIKKANPDACIYFCSTIPTSVEKLGLDFEGVMKKEFVKHPNLVALVKKKFGI